jgi:hypothetical protein
MSNSRPPQFFVCKNCGHKKSAFLVLKARESWGRGDPPIELVQKYLALAKCSVCGSKKVGVETGVPIGEARRNRLVATTESNEGVFHKYGCGWMNHVPLSSLIEIRDRQAAIDQGLTPCKSCRP